MVVFAPTGELAASYRKVFPWRPVETCEPGAEFVTVPIGDVGTADADGRSRAGSRSGASKAIVNQVFVASVNAAASRGEGRSPLVDPQGRILEAAVGAEPTVLAATIDLDEVRRTGEHGTAGVTKPWSQFVETDRPIDLPVYEGRITPQTWRPKT
jgi:predicted amidohydrolase